MQSDFTMDQFCAWLCNHENEIVGQPGMCFASPLSSWLSDFFHVTMGVEESRYGRASLPWWQWRILPRWATCFVLHMEQRAFQPVTGLDALYILADIEGRFSL